MSNKVPQIRFNGYSDAWVQRNLASLGKVFTGNTPKTSENENWTSDGTGHVWITPTDIQQLHTSNSDRHLSDIGWEKARVVPEKSVLITSIASIGKNTINTVPAAFNQQINAIVPEGADAEFILAVMEKESARFASLAGQTATAIINKTEFEKFKINAPSFDEQIRIGELFSKVDMLIAANQRKLDLLKKQKKGYLQKMFPKNGEKVPELRFAGFADAWEQRKLIDLLNQPITDGPHETPNLVEKGIPFISADAIVDNRIDFSRKRGFITEEYDLQCRKKYGPELYDVYLVKSGSTVGKVAIVETTKQFNIWSPLAAMRCKGKTNPYFLYFLFQTKENQNQVKSKASNGTQPNLSMRELEQFNVQISPLHDEQQKIGAFFKQLDSLITLHQRKLDLLKEQKKGFLQNMFV